MYPAASPKDSTVELIQDTFRPLIGVLCSEEAERHCQKNNLSFVKLIEPFCSIVEGNVRDVNNFGHCVKNFKIVCHDLNESSVTKLISKKKLNDIISRSYTLDAFIHNCQNHISHLGIPLDAFLVANLHFPDNKSEQNLKTPWYESYRKSFLESLPYSDHEYLRHYVACIVAVSTSEPNPLDQLTSLFQSPAHPSMGHSNTSVLTLLHDAKWFVPTFLRFVVLLHDVSEQDDMKAEAVYQAVKEKFGNQSCHLLHINSKSPQGIVNHKRGHEESHQNNPWLKLAADQNQSIVAKALMHSQDTDSMFSQNSTTSNHDHHLVDHPLMTSIVPHLADADDNRKVGGMPGECLSPSDIDRIQSFISQFITHSLFPWVERTLKNLNEQTSTRKGIKGSIFNASKWFGRSRPVGQGQSSSSVVYSSDSPEMQLRRLADLSFLFQLYELAYQTYHTIKKDFHSDSAWTHHAGALEMACLSVYLQGSSSSRQYPLHYMEQAIKSYYAGAHSISYAARATMLSTEILRSKSLCAEAATQFMTVTSEDSDLLSALFLEQTAHCFLEMKTPMVRKYAFHMVLAGHRFNKAGQKKHVLRCYAQALEIFKGKGWSLAEDHIYLTIGSQAYHIRELAMATSAYLHLLSPHSKQSANQQAAFFAQYLNIYRQQLSLSSPGEVPRTQLEILPLPLVHGKSIRVTCISNSQSSLEGKILASGGSLDEYDGEKDANFAELEERLVSAISRDSLAMNFFKPTVFCHSQRTDNFSNVLAVVGEPIIVEMFLENPLKIPLSLFNVRPLWRFSSKLGSLPLDGDCNDHDHFFSNEPSFQEKEQINFVYFQPIPEFHLEGLETKKLRVSITCRVHGSLHVTGLAFHLSSLLRSTPGNGSSIFNVDGGSANSGSSSVSGSSSFVSISGSNIAEQDLPFDCLLPQTQSVSNISIVPSTMSSAFSVSGMIPLEVCGNRLNTTKEEKMGTVYSLDRRLFVDALPVTIKLEMYLCNLPDSMLCGEVAQCMIEFVNCGQQNVTRLLLASNQTEMFSIADDCVVNIPYKKGTLAIALPKGGLPPGQSISKSLRIKCPDLSGNHPLDILALYNGDDNKDDSDKECQKMCSRMRYRLIRYSTCIKAEASIVIVSQTSHSSMLPPVGDNGGREEDSKFAGRHSIRSNIIVSVKTDNINPGYDFSIVQILCISKHWTLHLYDSLNAKRDTPIRPGECHLLSLRAYKETSHDGGGGLVSTLLLSNKEEQITVFDSQEVSTSADPCGQYSNQANTVNILNNAIETKFLLVIIWMAEPLANGVLRRFGRHILTFNRLEELVESVPVPKSPLSVPQIKFTNTKDMNCYPKTLSNETLSQMVRASLHFNSILTHDFGTKKPCIVHVKVTLLNCTDHDLNAFVEADDPVARPRESDITPDVHQPTNQIKSFIWIGRTKVLFKLHSNQNTTHTIKAKVFQAGVYDLRCIKTFVSFFGHKPPNEGDKTTDIPLSNDRALYDAPTILAFDPVPQKSLSPYFLQVLDVKRA